MRAWDNLILSSVLQVDLVICTQVDNDWCDLWLNIKYWFGQISSHDRITEQLNCLLNLGKSLEKIIQVTGVTIAITWNFIVLQTRILFTA